MVSILLFIRKNIFRNFHYSDKSECEKWKSPGVQAKAAFDFIATNSNELSFQTNDEITIAPKYIQDEMRLTNTGWAYAVFNGKSGVVPLNYLVIMKRIMSNKSTYNAQGIPVPRQSNFTKNGSEKKVSFGETEIINNTEVADKEPNDAPTASDDTDVAQFI